MAGTKGQPVIALRTADTENRSARERILASAEKLFAERGFDRTSTARIATAADVPHGLVFYYFKTKMDLLIAVTRAQEATMLTDLLLPPLEGVELTAAISALWVRLSVVLGTPSAVSRIVFQEMAHPEVRQLATEAHERIVASIRQYLAIASGHAGEVLAEHDAAARLLAIAAGIAPLLGAQSSGKLLPDAVAAVIANGVADHPGGPRR